MHPEIVRGLPSEPRVAEHATGSGSWLVDLSAQLSHAASFDGFDISNDAFFPKHDLPANVSLSVSDVKQPAASELHRKYDAVTIRFINVAMVPDDWKKAASHAAQLLKSGGALQWIEGDLLQLMTIYGSAPDTKTSALDAASHQALGKLDQLRWFVKHLHGVLVEAGFERIQHKITSTDRLAEDRKVMSEVCVGAIHGLLLRQARSPEANVTLEQVEALRHEMLDEVEGGAYVRADMHQFLAWKA